MRRSLCFLFLFCPDSSSRGKNWRMAGRRATTTSERSRRFPGVAPARQHDANLHENLDGQDDHAGCGTERHDSNREVQHPRQRGNPSGTTAVYLRVFAPRIFLASFFHSGNLFAFLSLHWHGFLLVGLTEPG